MLSCSLSEYELTELKKCCSEYLAAKGKKHPWLIPTVSRTGLERIAVPMTTTDGTHYYFDFVDVREYVWRVGRSHGQDKRGLPTKLRIPCLGICQYHTLPTL